MSFVMHHNLEHIMIRRGNCYDNAVAECFFNLLKRERIRRRLYITRNEARQDVFDYIELFYNPNANMLEMACCHQSNLKSNKNCTDKESRKLGAIQILEIDSLLPVVFNRCI